MTCQNSIKILYLQLVSSWDFAYCIFQSDLRTPPLVGVEERSFQRIHQGRRAASKKGEAGELQRARHFQTRQHEPQPKLEEMNHSYVITESEFFIEPY